MYLSGEARGQHSRRELLNTAIDCFARFGYQATSIDRIAREAGVTKGALYYHFKDKADLLSEAVTDRVGQWEQQVVDDVRAVNCAATRLRQVAQVCLDHATKSNHRRMIMTLMVEAIDNNAPLSAEFRAMMQRFRTFLKTLIDSGQRRGEFRKDIDADLAAELYAGAVMGAEIQYYLHPQVISLSRTLHAFLDQYLTWLGAGAKQGNQRKRSRATVVRSRKRARRS